MPTPTGLPKVGETWKRTMRVPSDHWVPHVTIFKVLSRSRGDYWAMRVQVLTIDGEPPSVYHRTQLWVDCAYWFSRGELEWVR